MSNGICLHCPHGAHPGLVCWASHMGDDCGCTGTEYRNANGVAPHEFDPNFKPTPDKCMRIHDEQLTCAGLGAAIKAEAIAASVELHPLAGRVSWRLLPDIPSLPDTDFCPFCGERIAYP